MPRPVLVEKSVIRFLALGEIEFQDLDPRSAESLLAQPKRLAVLAYLILATPERGPARDGTVSIFWPNATRERGRGSLRNALHFLRLHLGANAIRSHGDGLIVDPGVVGCDARLFQSRIAERRHEEALALYRGDLLAGIDLRESRRVDTWLEQERASFRREAADAAWAVAGEQESRGNWISATDHARRATSLSGDSERAVRRLMRLLDRAGDRVAALREYESFTARWEREYGLDPSPETAALAASLRTGSTRAGTPASPVRVRTGESSDRERRGTIAVLPFLLTDRASEHEYLATGLAHEVIASLSRLSHVYVIARTSVDRFRTREGRTPGQIGTELGVDTVLDGSLRIMGGRLAILARLVDVHTRAPIWAEVYEGDPRDLLSLRTELVHDVLDALKIDFSPEEAEHLARRPTSDPEAYRLYLEGRSLWSRRARRDVEAAIRRFERALELDPDFALALAGLAEAYLTLYPAAGVRASEARVRARDAARAALEIDPRLGEVHTTLGMLRGLWDLDWYGAEEEFRRAIELNPGHATAHHWYGAYLSFIFRRFEASAEELELARQLDPLSPIIQNDIGLALLNRGRPSEALEKFKEVLELEPEFWRGHYDLGVASVLSGDPDRGVAHLERAWRLGAYGATAEPEGAGDPEPRDWRDRLKRKLERLEASRLHRGLRGFESALVSMLLGDHDRALRCFRVVEDEGSWAVVAQYFSAFEPLRDRPEFVARLESAGLDRLISERG